MPGSVEDGDTGGGNGDNDGNRGDGAGGAGGLPVALWWSHLLNLFIKECLVVLKDPATRVILVVPVLLQSLLFGYGATFDLKTVDYAVLDQSREAASIRLLAQLEGSGRYRRVASLQSSAQIAPLIDAGKVLMVLHIGPDFGKRLAAGQTAPMQLLLDGRNSSTAAAALAQVQAMVARFNAMLAAAGTGADDGNSGIRLEVRAWYNPNLESRWQIMPALIASLSMIQVMMLAALSVAREREQGTFDQLLVTPATPGQIMASKALPAVMIGLLQSSLILLVVRWWFGVPMIGSLKLLMAGLLAFNLAVVGIGLTISALSRNMQQAMLYAFMLLVPLVLLSGLLTSVRNMPKVLQWVTLGNPLRSAVELVRRVYLEGAVLTELWSLLIPFSIMAACTLPLAAWLFRNRLA